MASLWNNEVSDRVKTYLKIVGILLLTIPAYYSARMFANTWENLANTDFMTFWLAGKSLVMGFDAYDPEEWQFWNRYFGSTWIFNPRFIYPLPLRLLLGPLGLIAFPNAYLLWTMISQFLVIFSVYLLYMKAEGRRHLFTFLFMAFGAIFFRATYAALRFGQIGPWLLLSMAGSIFLWEKEKRFWSGVVLALIILKPTIGGPYILLTVIWMAVKKHWEAIWGLLAGGIGLLILGVLQDPLWVVKFLESGNQKFGETFAYAPNVWGLARLITNGKAIVLVGGVTTILLIGGVMRFALRQNYTLSFKEFFSLITPVVLFTTPYLWGYDQIFLLISLTLSAERKHHSPGHSVELYTGAAI